MQEQRSVVCRIRFLFSFAMLVLLQLYFTPASPLTTASSSGIPYWFSSMANWAHCWKLGAMIKVAAVFVSCLHSSQTSLSFAVSFHSSFFCFVWFVVNDIANLPSWASACRMLPFCWQLAWEELCVADLGKILEKPEKINFTLPLLPTCESECVGFWLCCHTKGPFSPPVPRLSFLTVSTVLPSGYHSRDKLG